MEQITQTRSKNKTYSQWIYLYKKINSSKYKSNEIFLGDELASKKKNQSSHGNKYRILIRIKLCFRKGN